MDITFTSPDNFKFNTKQLTIAYGDKQKSKVDLRLLSQAMTGQAADGEVVFDGPGEYEVKSCMVTGVVTSASNTAYQISVDDLKLGILGDLESPLTDQQVEQLGAIDVLVISLDKLKTDDITKQIAAIEPSIVIPMNFDDAALAALAKDMGVTVEPIEKLKVTKKELPDDTVLTVLQ